MKILLHSLIFLCSFFFFFLFSILFVKHPLIVSLVLTGLAELQTEMTAAIVLSM